MAYIVMGQYSYGLCSDGLYTPRTRFRRAASPTIRPAFLWTNSHCGLSVDLFLTTFRGMPTANAEGLGRIRRAPVGKVSARPSAPLGSSAFAVGMLRDKKNKNALGLNAAPLPGRSTPLNGCSTARMTTQCPITYTVMAYMIWPIKSWPI